MISFIIREMQQNEKEIIGNIAKQSDNPTCKSFYNIWTRFGNWQKNPPIIVEIDNNIVAFMAFTINKNEYINFYEIVVKPEFQKQGIATKLWEQVLNIAHENKKTKIKCLAHEDYAGFYFFKSFLNWQPIEKNGKEWRFDGCIKNILTIEDFRLRINQK